MTALFGDFKRSTELMADLDSEEARAIIDPALRLVIDTVLVTTATSCNRRRRHLRAVVQRFPRGAYRRSRPT
jgi:hypothetical protein